MFALNVCSWVSGCDCLGKEKKNKSKTIADSLEIYKNSSCTSLNKLKYHEVCCVNLVLVEAGKSREYNLFILMLILISFLPK